MNKISKEDLMAYIEEGMATPVIITEDEEDCYALIDMYDYDMLMMIKAFFGSIMTIGDDVALIDDDTDHQEMADRYAAMFDKIFGPDTEKMN